MSTFWSLTKSDFQTNQTFHQFHDIDTDFDLHRLWVVSMEHLQRVWHASREHLPFRTPGSVLHCGTCLCSSCWDQIPRTCHVFTRLFTSNTPWYFLDFAFNLYLLWFAEFELQKCNYLFLSLLWFHGRWTCVDFGFPIVNFPWLSGDNHRLPWYGNCISQLVRFSRCCTSVLDFHFKTIFKSLPNY